MAKLGEEASLLYVAPEYGATPNIPPITVYTTGSIAGMSVEAVAQREIDLQKRRTCKVWGDKAICIYLATVACGIKLGIPAIFMAANMINSPAIVSGFTWGGIGVLAATNAIGTGLCVVNQEVGSCLETWSRDELEQIEKDKALNALEHEMQPIVSQPRGSAPAPYSRHPLEQSNDNVQIEGELQSSVASWTPPLEAESSFIVRGHSYLLDSQYDSKEDLRNKEITGKQTAV